MRQQGLKIFTISILICYTILLSSCSIVNGQKYAQMYGDAITYRSVAPHAKYVNTTPDNFNEKFNETLYTTLITRVSNTGVMIDEQLLDELNGTIDEFRSDQIVYKVIGVNENSLTGTIRISVSDVYSGFLVEMNKHSNEESYDKFIFESLISAFENSKRIDVIEIEINLEYDDEKELYSIGDESIKTMVDRILGI